MKILTIRGAGLASLAEPFEVNLSQGPLAGVGLFAITGPTGAGKSTLLDALCLALFDRTPRLASQSSVKMMDFAGGEEISNNDPRGILSRGRASGYAEVDFVGQDHLTYRARWSVSRARGRDNGRLQPSDLSLQRLPGGEALGDGKTRVKEEIKKALGLSFEQFTRSVLLAQGEFAAFLKAKDTERSELLEKLTGTEIYTSISLAVYEKAKLEKQEWERLKAALDQIQVMNPEQRQHQEEELRQLQDRGEELEAEEGRLKELLSRLELGQKLQQKRDSAVQQMEQVTQVLHQILPRREELLLARRVVTQMGPLLARRGELEEERREYLNQLNEMVQKLSAAQADLGRADEWLLELVRQEQALHILHQENGPRLEVARQLDLELATARTRLDAARREVETSIHQVREQENTLRELEVSQKSLETQAKSLTARLHARARLADLAGERGRWQERLRRYEQARRAQREVADKLGEADARLEVLRRQVALGQRRRQEIEGDLHLKEGELTRLSARRQELLARLRPEERTHQEHRAHHLDELVRVDVRALRRQMEGSSQDYTQIQHRLERLVSDTKDNGQLLEVGRIRLEESKVSRQVVAAELGVGGRRVDLVEGDPCPLCGSISHPWVDRAVPGEDAIRALDERIRKQGEELERLRTTQAAAEAEQARLVTVLGHLKGETLRLEGQIGEALLPWLAADMECLPELVGFTPDAEGVRERLAELRQDTRSWLAEWKLQEQEYRNLEKQVTALTTIRDELRRKWEGANQEVHAGEKTQGGQAATCQALREQLEQVTGEKQTHHAELVPLLQVMPPLVTLLEAEGQAEVHLEHELGEFFRDQESEAKNRQEQRELALSRGGILLRLEELRTHHQLRVQDLEKEQQAVEVLSTQRSRLFEGRVVAEVEANQRRAEEKITRQTQAALQEKSDAAGRYNTAVEVHRQGQIRVGEIESEWAGICNQLEEGWSRLGVEAERATPWFDRDPEWWEEEKKQVEEVENRHKEASVQLKVHQQQLTEFEAGWGEHPPPERQEVADHLEATLSLGKELSERLTRGKVALTRDNDALELRKGQQPLLDAQTQKVELVSKLADVIGSADGKKFRVFAQSLTLDVVLSYANYHLRELFRRYSLQRIQAHDLDLEVIDQDMGGEVRSIHSLSGGETFLVSLALALGLASVTSQQVAVESLFIDEGFGTLDPLTLEMALATLDTLQSRGRQIGLISHVSGMVERIGARVEVHPLGVGRSRVVVCG